MQCVAVVCSVLLCVLLVAFKSTASCSPVLPLSSGEHLMCVALYWCSELQCGAVWYNVVQRGAVCCSVLQCVAVCCSVLQCAAVCCSALQCVAMCCARH